MKKEIELFDHLNSKTNVVEDSIPDLSIIDYSSFSIKNKWKSDSFFNNYSQYHQFTVSIIRIKQTVFLSPICEKTAIITG